MVRRLAITAAVVACLSWGARAASLDPPRQATPDIFSSFIDVTYDAGSDVLTASGFALEINVPPTETITGSNAFQLSVRVDDGGNLLGPGTNTDLVIDGDIPALGLTDGTQPLLTGRVEQFGFGVAGDPLEFIFSVTGGEAASLYGGIGWLGGVTMAGTGFTGSFATDFNNNFGIPGFGQGLADTYVIPEPLTAVLVVPVVLLGRLARRRWGLPRP